MKNKKRLNILVAAFTVIFLAGSVFAFTAAGPLLFSGTANVNASLRVAINSQETKVTYADNVGIIFEDIVYSVPSIPNFYDVATMGVAFTGMGNRVEVEFEVENIGTMPATVTGFEVTDVLRTQDDRFTITQVSNNGDAVTLQPGETTRLTLVFALDHTNIGNEYITEQMLFEFALEYVPAE
ncbi:MAG: hypothetical protein FWC97_05835 [Treponema sp.]|nr:hypothetical protein [Treponema sp.]